MFSAVSATERKSWRRPRRSPCHGFGRTFAAPHAEDNRASQSPGRGCLATPAARLKSGLAAKGTPAFRSRRVQREEGKPAPGFRLPRESRGLQPGMPISAVGRQRSTAQRRSRSRRRTNKERIRLLPRSERRAPPKGRCFPQARRHRQFPAARPLSLAVSSIWSRDLDLAKVDLEAQDKRLLGQLVAARGSRRAAAERGVAVVAADPEQTV